ncbi:hypothetical protein QYF36_009414 [Acer negundo]|nr:hypothetical protein QYF36_009414 [Acer negundo]
MLILPMKPLSGWKSGISQKVTPLQLLKAAIFDMESSPVEDYFLYIVDLQELKKKEVEIITRPILDARGDDYSVCCEGTAFLPLQVSNASAPSA